ncbi:chorismate mutase [Corynebacterium sp. TAE3-ERU12]|uniref:chorismate mutase n=1 Tax=Corynebacterium sp. TAE3-ERU12 TaxID=2849491 RepID=UPI001C4513F1|nr:chorismate mutase [Corynebacterium sp. TAE3-ERU12]MBV7294776.1 chorismate mutase [Corynebacterium sp. TAE3-ERU12]
MSDSNSDPSAHPHHAVHTFEVRTPTGTDDPLGSEEIERYRNEINRLDELIIEAAKRRAEISQAVGRTRMGTGGTRLVHTRELQIIHEFRNELGSEGPAIATALLRMGRGRLGYGQPTNAKTRKPKQNPAD